MLAYKNFNAEINYIAHTSCFYGEVINISDLIIFQAEYKKDLAASFKTAAEQYYEYLRFTGLINVVNLVDLEKETLV